MARTKVDELTSLLRGQGAVMQETYSILEQEEKQDQLVRAAIHASLKHRRNQLDGLDPERMFGLEDIRRTCIKYRLRFLPSGRYKGRLPAQAVQAVRHLEHEMGKPVHGFMMLAPAQRFQLCDSDADPVLFIPLSNGSYYLLHRWGRDMHPLRAVLGWPVRNWAHLVGTVTVFAVVLAALLPTRLLASDPMADWWGLHRFGAFVCIASLAGAATSLCWFTFFGQFSAEAWRSKHFN
ncbi:MAG: hypothetical protein KBH07_12970 [Flavobacteriales bacterium]|nr:hypothetical protein [Flavobacteriales bacterium]MBP9079714.1 hypothetical protein [Flavobacteriales bacterium]